MLRIAMPKGRMSEESLEYFYEHKITSVKTLPDNRQLVFQDEKNSIEILLIRAKDVGVYVEQAVVDLGIIGYDLIMEEDYQVFIPLKLPFGKCRLSVAYPKGDDQWKKRKNIRVATKYPRLASDFLYLKGYNTEIIELYGSIEIAPLTKMSDIIVDLISTGQTLKMNHLVEDQLILNSQACLIVNPSVYYHKRDKINHTLDCLHTFSSHI